MTNHPSSNRKNPNVLIVDDLPANLRLLGEILKNEGYNIRQVPNGELALQVIEKEKPSLILLDIMMPGMDGYEVCRRLKSNQNFKDIPVIFISALNETNDIVKSLALGGVDYINKPFKAEEVIARVNTHLKLYQQSIELHELNATKDKFFSIIAHDLRSPFTGFLGLSHILMEEAGTMPPEMVEELAGMLNKSANSLFKLLENLLDWARMQQGIITFDPEPFSVSDKINGCQEVATDSARNKEIRIIADIPENLQGYADIRMFETVVRNLVSNAVKFTGKGGTVSISAREPEPGFLEVTISDSGIGMKKEMVDNLFNINIKTGRAGTEGETSTGLGLIICKDFIEKHGGEVFVDSEEGKGSTFRFRLPQKSKLPDLED